MTSETNIHKLMSHAGKNYLTNICSNLYIKGALDKYNIYLFISNSKEDLNQTNTEIFS